MTKKVSVYAMKCGIIAHYKRIGGECFGELGLRYKNQSLIDNEFDPSNDSFPDGFWPWEKPYTGLLPHFNVGLKINYRIF